MSIRNALLLVFAAIGIVAGTAAALGEMGMDDAIVACLIAAVVATFLTAALL